LRISCAPPTVAGDLDGDGSVARGDLALLVRSFGTADESTVCMGDFTGDGAVGVADLAWLQARLSPIAPASPGATAAVPEPNGVILVALAASMARVRRRFSCGPSIFCFSIGRR
jgi:hypothetical protein